MSLPGRQLSHIQFLKNPIFDRTTSLIEKEKNVKTATVTSDRTIRLILIEVCCI